MMFNYEELEQKINEVFGSKEAFGKELGLTKQRISSKLGGNDEFTLSEIGKAVEVLNINPIEIPSYFFNVGVCVA